MRARAHTHTHTRARALSSTFACRQFNFPEHSCCACGKDGGQAAPAPAPAAAAAAAGAQVVELGPEDLEASEYYSSYVRDGALHFDRRYDPSFSCGGGAFM